MSVTALLEIVDDPAVSAGRVNSDLSKISVWADNGGLCFLCMKRKKIVHPLFLNFTVAKEFESHTVFGLTLQSNMLWRDHTVQIYEKASKRLNILKFIKYKVDRSS